MKRDIDIQIKREDIIKALAQCIKGNYSDKIAETIIGVLGDNDMAINHVFKATMGIFREFEYKVGDTVLVSMNALNDWMFNAEEMIEKGLCDKNQYVRCDIIQCLEYDTDHYKVQYNAWKDNDYQLLTYSIRDYKIEGLAEEWPAEIVEIKSKL